VLAVIRKDFLVMRRDLRNMSQLISPLIFGVIYALMLLRSGGEPPPGQGEAPDWFMDSFRNVLTYGSVFISLFVGWTLSSRLAGIGFSQEGKNYWILKASPVRAGYLLAAKFLVSYLPTLFLGLFFLIVISFLQGFSPVGFAYSLAIVALSLAGINGILVGFGAAGANFNWDDPRKMNAGSMGCLGQILAMIYLPVSFIFFIGPLVVASAFQMAPLYGYLTGLIVGVAVNLTCAILPLMLVTKRVERLGEQ
jgi:ABC-2 type transport system permease protein